MTPHHLSTYAWGALLVLCVGLAVGFAAGLRYSPSYQDALMVERRLREVFCEQAVKNGLLKTCEVMTP